MKNIKGRDEFIKENILPKPYKKVKCLECGESVCDNLSYKIGHLYNKHNCKPSVDDYKAKAMLDKYFAKGIKEGFVSKWGEEIICPYCGGDNVFEDKPIFMPNSLMKPLKDGKELYICDDCGDGFIVDSPKNK